MKLFFLLFVLLFSHLSFSQNCFKSASGLEKLKFGFSTTYDAEQALGKNSLTMHHFYYDKGAYLTFNSNKILELIILKKPFKGSFQNRFHVVLDSSNIEDVVSFFPHHTVDLTQNAEHCILKTSLDSINIVFYASAIKTTDIVEYKDFLIQKIELSPKSQEFSQQKESENGYCELPLYAPENETHLNCWVFEHSGGLMGGLEPVEQGYHKYYGLTHKLESEGSFGKGEKIGIWKYYDDNGTPINTQDHSNIPSSWKAFIIVLLIFALIFFIASRKKT